jgi:hypothetical protein
MAIFAAMCILPQIIRIGIENAGPGHPNGPLGETLRISVEPHQIPPQSHRAADREQRLARAKPPPDLLALGQTPGPGSAAVSRLRLFTAATREKRSGEARQSRGTVTS